MYTPSTDIWVELSFTLPTPADMHGAIFLSTTQILIFAGFDTEANALNTSIIFDLESGESHECEPMVSHGGCIVSEIVCFENYVYTFIFQGYTSRNLERWDRNTQLWESLDIYN
jgi:hypothetical protein